jgi:hypothetical protein
MAITVTTHCCFRKQLDELFKQNFSNKRQRSTAIVTDGDWPLSDFLRWVVYEVPGMQLHLMLPSIDIETIKTISQLLAHRVPDTSFDGILQSVFLLLPKQDKRRRQQDIAQDVQDELVALSDRFGRRVSIGYGNIASSVILFSGASFAGEGTRSFTMTGDFCQVIDNRQRLITIDSTTSTHDDLASQIERIIRVANSKRKQPASSVRNTESETKDEEPKGENAETEVKTEETKAHSATADETETDDTASEQ